MRHYSQEATLLFREAAKVYGVHTKAEPSVEGLIDLIHGVDPSPGKKYVRWIAERLVQRAWMTDECSWDLHEGSSSQVYRLLLCFEQCKAHLPVELRNILNYRSLKELYQAIKGINLQRTHCAPGMLSKLSFEQVYTASKVKTACGISLHKPMCIEEASLLIGNPVIMETSGENLYSQLVACGEVTVFLSDGGSLIGSVPYGEDDRGILYDCFGEQAVFEDMLMVANIETPIDWENCKDILSEMIKIDPALPFDTEMTEIEPYQLALKQFPLILHEDREIPDDLREAILADTQVLRKIMGVEL